MSSDSKIKIFHDSRCKNELNLFELIQVGHIEVNMADKKIYASGRNRRFQLTARTMKHYGTFTINGNRLYFSYPIE